jgi:hypothetical protein
MNGVTAYAYTKVEPNIVLYTYDRLAEGWAYAPGPFWTADFVFAMRFHITIPNATTDKDQL